MTTLMQRFLPILVVLLLSVPALGQKMLAGKSLRLSSETTLPPNLSSNQGIYNANGQFTWHEYNVDHDLITGTPTNNQNYIVDLTSTSAATKTVTQENRTGGPLYIVNGFGTAASYTPGTSILFEDRYDGRGGGVWTIPSYSNGLGNPFDHVTGWTQTGSGTTLTPGVGVGPDGVATYDRLADSSTTDRSQDYKALTLGQWMHSEWIRDSPGNPPFSTTSATAHGALLVNGFGTNGVSYGLGANWRRVAVSTSSSNYHIIGGPGTDTSGFDLSAIGALDVWGSQAVSGTGLDVPLVNTTTGSSGLVLKSNAVSQLVDTNGDIELEGAYFLDLGDSIQQDSGYIFAMNTPQGEFSLRFDQANGWIWKVKGTDLSTVTGGKSVVKGSIIRWRAWYQPSKSSGGLQILINGAEDYRFSQSATIISGPIGAATAAYLGRDLSGANYFGVRHIYLMKMPPFRPEIVVFGDSISSEHGSYQPLTSSFLYLNGEGKTRPGITSLAAPSKQIADQLSTWNSSPYVGMSSIRAFILQLGINDINAGRLAPAVAADYQNLINTIKRTNPTAKVIACLLTPDKQYSDTLSPAYYTEWKEFNKNLLGVGAVPITGIDAVVTGTQAQLDDGNGNLAPVYDSNDHIHPIYSGRQLMANAWRQALTNLGLITSDTTINPTNVIYGSNVYAHHFACNGISPTIVAGAGAGTSPTVSVSGLDCQGTISVTTGTLPSASATLATVTFGNTFDSPPNCHIVPANGATQALIGTSFVTWSTSTTSLILTTGSTSLAPLTSFKWSFACTQ